MVGYPQRCKWVGLVSNQPRHKPVPPTPFYYGVRAELFLHDAEQALLQGDRTKHDKMMLKAIEYRELAGQFPPVQGHA